jgi:hypothetical protein
MVQPLAEPRPRVFAGCGRHDLWPTDHKERASSVASNVGDGWAPSALRGEIR